MKPWTIVCVALVWGGVAEGQTEEEIKDELKAVVEQMADQRRAKHGSALGRQLQQKMMEAREAYQKAMGEIPSMKRVQEQLAGNREQARNLALQKAQLIGENAELLKGPKRQWEAAHRAYREYVVGRGTNETLHARQQELIRQLMERRRGSSYE